MARRGLHLKVRWDPKDREAFLADVERIALKYGDQPHLRRARDAELERAVQVFVDGVTVEVK